METPNQTEMVGSQAGKTTMTKPPKEQKMVKVKCQRSFALPLDGPMEKRRQIVENQVVEVSEEDAKKLCDDAYAGGFAFAGERFNEDGEVSRHKIRHAVRV